MDLNDYLNHHFYTKQRLLELTKVSEQKLAMYQKMEVMPLSSYRLKLDLQCDSFFGLHQAHSDIEYFAKGYVSWLSEVRLCGEQQACYSNFSRRYRKQLESLKQAGHECRSAKLNEQLELHIEQEWRHFLDGTYGLCTRTGLPEDIAAKEMAVAEIEELTACDSLDDAGLKKLQRAVNLLDGASSLFAPHERSRSSRHRLIDEVRRTYQLPTTTNEN